MGSSQLDVHEENLHEINQDDLRARLDDALNPPPTPEQKRSNVLYHDFSKVKQLTDLQIEKTVEKPEEKIAETTEEKPLRSAVDIAMSATDKYAETKAAPEASTGAFEVPEELSAYVNELIKEGKPLKYLRWDLTDSIKSKDAWKKTIGNYRERGVMSEEEYDKAVSLLGKMPDEDDSLPTAKKIAMKVTDKYVEKKPEVKIEPEPEPEPVHLRVVERPKEKDPEKPIEKPAEVLSPDATIDQEALDKNLADARESYVGNLSNHKGKIRAKKGTFGKLLAELGVDRQLPETEEPREVVDARKAYLEAKKLSYSHFFSKAEVKSQVVSSQMIPYKEIAYEVNEPLAEASEKEYILLQKRLLEALPDSERVIIDKGFAIWNKISRSGRTALSVALGFGAGYVFGKGTDAVAEAYSGYRADKGIASGIKRVDGIFKKKIEEGKAGDVSEYKTNIDEVNFAEREKAFMGALEKEKDLKKKQRLVKAGLVSATGINPELVPPATMRPVDVTLTAGDFIGNIQRLKMEIVKQYATEEIPELAQDILDTPNIELAKQFSFYKATRADGGAFDGGTLTVDQKGNIICRRKDGSREVVIHSKPENPEVFVAGESPAGEAIINDIPREEKAIDLSLQPKAVEEKPKEITAETVIESVPTSSFAFKGESISHEEGGFPVLNDEFQEGKQYEALRESFARDFDVSLTDMGLGTTPIALPFEGGKIYVTTGEDRTVRVLLNGKEIARGLPDGGGKSVKILPKLKGPLFVDTLYKRAFKQADTALKGIKAIA